RCPRTCEVGAGFIAVAGGLDHAPSVLCDLRIDQLATMGLELRKRPRLVHPHQPAVASDIGGQDGTQLTFDALCRHSGTLSAQYIKPNSKSGVGICMPMSHPARSKPSPYRGG